MRSPFRRSGEPGRRRPRIRLALLGPVVLLSPVLLLATCQPPTQVGLQLAGIAPPRPASLSAEPARFTDTAFVAPDGTRLPLRRWLPQGGVKAVVLALHGFGDYSRAFAEPATLWARQGIATYAYDQRGFGAAPERGRWVGDGRLALDAVVATRILRRTYPGVPLYLLGESMGGAVAVLAATGALPPRGETMPVADVDGLVLSAPAVWGRETMDLLPKAALFVAARLFPTMVLTGSGLRIKASDNLPMLRALARDPLVMKGARVDTIYGLVDLMDDALDAAPRLRLPTLLMYGAHDEVVPRAALTDFTAHLPRDAGRRDRLAYYRHGYHLLLRDLDGADVARDVATWILDRNAPLPSGADAREALRPWPPRAAAH